MTRPSRNILVILGVALFAAGLLAGWVGARLTARRDVTTIAFYGDWRVACPAATEKNQGCELGREIIDGKTRTRAAALRLGHAGGKTVLVVTAPLNVLIGPGLGFGLGNDKPHVYRFTTCIGSGCIAQIPVDDAMLAALREEPQARIQFAALNKQVMQVSFPLSGFKRADDAASRSDRLFW